MERVYSSKKLFFLSLLAFIAVLWEIIVIIIEAFVYNMDDIMSFSNLSLSQSIIHWSITCILWGISALLLIRSAQKSGLNLLAFKEKPSSKQWLVVLFLFIIALILSYISWDYQFKPLAELNKKIYRSNLSSGIILFIFQYIYYFFEGLLITLIIALSQNAFENSKGSPYIPWGGILCGLTWAVAHIASKGLSTAIECFILALLMGSAYICLKKNFRISYIVLTLMFVF